MQVLLRSRSTGDGDPVVCLLPLDREGRLIRKPGEGCEEMVSRWSVMDSNQQVDRAPIPNSGFCCMGTEKGKVYLVLLQECHQ